MTLLFGVLEDNFGFIYFVQFLKTYGSEFVSVVSQPFSIAFSYLGTSEPIFFETYFFISKYLNPILQYNIIALSLFIANLVVANKFFKNILGNKPLSYFLSLLFAISPYFMYRYRSHLTLMFVFLAIINIYLILKPNIKKSLLFAPVNIFLTLISNYLGFFSLVIYSLYLFSFLLVQFFTHKKFNIAIKDSIINYFVNMFVYSIFAFFVFLPMLNLNVGNIFGAEPLDTNQPQTNSFQLPQRSIEDFVIFSSRPWYFVLPSSDNFFYGAITSSIISSLLKTEYFLFNNYFVSEHSASFLGIINIVMAIIGLFAVYKKNFFAEQTHIIYPLFITFVFISLIMMPPFISIAGIKIYLPSYLFYEFFTMFRVLARLGVFNLLIILVFSGIGYLYIMQLYKGHKNYILIKAFIVFIAFVSITEFWIPLNLTDLGDSKAPEVFKYLGTQDHKGSVIVYPFSYANSTLVWHNVHKMPAFNSKFSTVGFDPRKFTDNLSDETTLLQAKNLGASYLIVFGDANFDFFNDSDVLQKIKSFPKQADPYLTSNFVYKIKYIGPYENAILYKFK